MPKVLHGALCPSYLRRVDAEKIVSSIEKHNGESNEISVHG